jgi:hypothetical protein
MRAHIRSVTIAIALLVSLVSTSGVAHATEVGYTRKYGLGAVVGDPTGLSGKMWVGPTNAIDVGLGFYGYGVRGGCYRDRDNRAICDRRYGQSSTSLHVDYLWQSKLIDRAAQLDWHVGAGARMFFLGAPCAYDCWNVGARVPIGLDLTFREPSFLEVFLELAPVFYVAPATFLAMEGGLGVRGYF